MTKASALVRLTGSTSEWFQSFSVSTVFWSGGDAMYESLGSKTVQNVMDVSLLSFPVSYACMCMRLIERGAVFVVSHVAEFVGPGDVVTHVLAPCLRSAAMVCPKSKYARLSASGRGSAPSFFHMLRAQATQICSARAATSLV